MNIICRLVSRSSQIWTFYFCCRIELEYSLLDKTKLVYHLNPNPKSNQKEREKNKKKIKKYYYKDNLGHADTRTLKQNLSANFYVIVLLSSSNSDSIYDQFKWPPWVLNFVYECVTVCTWTNRVSHKSYFFFNVANAIVAIFAA